MGKGFGSGGMGSRDLVAAGAVEVVVRVEDMVAAVWVGRGGSGGSGRGGDTSGWRV